MKKLCPGMTCPEWTPRIILLTSLCLKRENGGPGWGSDLPRQSWRQRQPLNLNSAFTRPEALLTLNPRPEPESPGRHGLRFSTWLSC